MSADDSGSQEQPPLSSVERFAIAWLTGPKTDMINNRTWYMFKEAKILQTRPSQKCDEAAGKAQVDLLLLDFEGRWTHKYLCVVKLKGGKFHIGKDTSPSFYTWADWWKYAWESD